MFGNFIIQARNCCFTLHFNGINRNGYLETLLLCGAALAKGPLAILFYSSVSLRLVKITPRRRRRRRGTVFESSAVIVESMSERASVESEKRAKEPSQKHFDLVRLAEAK